MLRVYRLLVVAFLLGGCYTQNKAVKQVNKALGSYPEIVAKIALDSFPCNVIKVDTIITHFDTTIEVFYPHFDTNFFIFYPHSVTCLKDSYYWSLKIGSKVSPANRL